MYLTDGENLQSIHANFWVEKLQFTVTSVNNNLDSINCNQQQRYTYINIAKSNIITVHI